MSRHYRDLKIRRLVESGSDIRITKMDNKIHRKIGYHLNGSVCRVYSFNEETGELMVGPYEDRKQLLFLPTGWLGILWEYELWDNERSIE